MPKASPRERPSDAARRMTQPDEALEPSCRIDEAGPTSTVHLAGVWQLGRALPSAESAAQGLHAASEVRFDVSGLKRWDTGLMVFLLQLGRLCRERGLEVDPTGLPEGAQRLYRLATAVPPAARAEPKAPANLFWRVGQATLASAAEARAMITFIGEATLAFGRLVTGRARFHRSDLVLTIQEVGAQALPIVSLISFLVGVILAFLGSVQLLQFGAQIYVAHLVGIGMARDMAAMMVGIILAGRTGAAFAAQLGTMQVNEEIDALTTFGFAPMEFLVLPRMLALVLMTPLLCLYADLMGILGGAFVGVMFLGLPRRHLFSGDPGRRAPDRLRRRPVQGRGLRGPGRGRRLPAGHPMRAQLGRGRPGDHLGRGDLDRPDRGLDGDPDGDLQCPRHLTRRSFRKRASPPARAWRPRRTSSFATWRWPTAASS